MVGRSLRNYRRFSLTFRQIFWQMATSSQSHLPEACPSPLLLFERRGRDLENCQLRYTRFFGCKQYRKTTVNTFELLYDISSRPICRGAKRQSRRTSFGPPTVALLFTRQHSTYASSERGTIVKSIRELTRYYGASLSRFRARCNRSQTHRGYQ